MTLSNIFGNLFKLFTTVENWLWRLWLFIFLGYTLSKKEMVFVNLKTHFCFDGTEFEEEIPYNFWGSMFDFNKCYSCNIWVIHFQPGILSYHLRALPKGTQGKHSFFFMISENPKWTFWGREKDEGARSLLRPSVCLRKWTSLRQATCDIEIPTFSAAESAISTESKQTKLPLKERSLGPNLLKDPLLSTHLFRCFFSEFQRWEDQNSHKKSTFFFAWQFFDLLRKITKIPKENPMDEWT